MKKCGISGQLTLPPAPDPESNGSGWGKGRLDTGVRLSHSPLGSQDGRSQR